MRAEINANGITAVTHFGNLSDTCSLDLASLEDKIANGKRLNDANSNL